MTPLDVQSHQHRYSLFAHSVAVLSERAFGRAKCNTRPCQFRRNGPVVVYKSSAEGVASPRSASWLKFMNSRGCTRG
jgi:hypothetical protein